MCTTATLLWTPNLCSLLTGGCYLEVAQFCKNSKMMVVVGKMSLFGGGN
jgi:hypothetical protein